MTQDQLYKELNFVNHSREKRLYYANLVIANPKLISPLLNILFMVDDKISCRAAWVLEFVTSKNVNILNPYLDIFTKNIHKIHLDSAVRPIAKICECLAKAHFSEEENTINLKPLYIERIVEVCFNYMINNEKVAPKAYSMNTLYLFGKNIEWIHPELMLILERDYLAQSAAFKARARHIFKKLKT